MKFLFPLLVLFSLPVMGEITDDTTRWQVEVSVDDFTDEKTVVAVVLSEKGYQGGLIHLMCKGDYFEVKVGAGEYIGDKRINNNVLYRVDKDEPVKTTMNPTSKNYVYFNDSNAKFLADLMNGSDQVIVRLTSYDYDTSTAKFTLKGSTSAIQQVIDACVVN